MLFDYWYNIVLVVLTRSASSVDVECMFSITGQISNVKQSSPMYRRPADKLSFRLYATISSSCLSMADMSRLTTKLQFIFGSNKCRAPWT